MIKKITLTEYELHDSVCCATCSNCFTSENDFDSVEPDFDSVEYCDNCGKNSRLIGTHWLLIEFPDNINIK